MRTTFRKELVDLFIFGTVINHNLDFMHIKYALAVCQNVAFMSICLLYVCSDISEMNQLILFMLGTVIYFGSVPK